MSLFPVHARGDSLLSRPTISCMHNVHRRVGEVTVLVLYTAGGMQDLQSTSGADMETKITAAFTRTQKAFQDSGIPLNIKLVKTVSGGFLHGTGVFTNIVVVVRQKRT